MADQPQQPNGNSGTMTAIEFLREGFGEVKDRLDKIDAKLEPLPALHVRVGMIERIVFTAVGLILVAVVGGLVKLVLIQ